MTKRLLVTLCILLLTVSPITATTAAQVNTFFPAQSQFAMAAATGSPTHSVLGVKLDTLELFFVILNSIGAPPAGFSWAYGTIVSVTLLNPNTVRVTWLLRISTGGNAPFIPADTITIDFAL